MMISTMYRNVGALAIAVGIAATGAQARASIFTATGTSAGVPVSASADFSFSGGSVEISLTNTTAHTNDAGQLLTGVRFTLANGGTNVTTAVFSATGNERTIADDGSYVDSGLKSLSWELKTGSTLQLDFNPDAKDALVGPADGESTVNSVAGIYNTNGSISGSPGHNPYAAEMGTFTLTSGLIVPTTTVSNVVFLYNTALSQTVNGTPFTPTAAPEPMSLAVLGLGAAGLLLKRR
jgi:hypothetical protein